MTGRLWVTVHELSSDRSSRMELPYPPTTGNHQHGAAGRRRWLLSSVRVYREAVGAEVMQERAKGWVTRDPLIGPVRLEVTATPPDKRRRDLSNLLKVLEDALTAAGVWQDDSQVVEIRMRWEAVA